MNRRELAKTLQAQLLYDNDPNDPVFPNFRFADETLQLIFDLIAKQLDAGEEVSIAGFGHWKIRETPAGMRRNPQTQAMVRVPASKKVRFYPSVGLKASVAGKSRTVRRATSR